MFLRGPVQMRNSSVDIKIKRRSASSCRLHYASIIQLSSLKILKLRIRWAVLPPSAPALRWACGPAFALKGLQSWSKTLHNIPKLSLTGEVIVPWYKGDVIYPEVDFKEA